MPFKIIPSSKLLNQTLLKTEERPIDLAATCAQIEKCFNNSTGLINLVSHIYLYDEYQVFTYKQYIKKLNKQCLH